MVRRAGAPFDRHGPAALTGRDHAAAVIAEHCWPQRPQPRIGSIGLEVEMLPMRLANDGQPAGRVRLTTLARWLDDYAPQKSAVRGPPWRWHLPGHGDLTFEPGGQLEYSTRPMPTAAAALDDLERVCGVLAAALEPHGVALVSAGLDLWHPLRDVAQQLPHPRYRAMHDYFERRHGPDGPGATMMRHTCAFQVNLDLGGPAIADERWLLATLLSPLVIATFAASPTPDGRSTRSRAWQRLDPTRTGVPPTLATRPSASVVDHLTEHALAADVLCLPTPDGGLQTGVPGFRFADWMRAGHPRAGRPTTGDLRYHLTTLWPDVRTRGFLEIRGIDALPARWRAAPVALLAGLLYDDRARGDALALLTPYRRRLRELSTLAAHVGLADPALCAVAVDVWTLGARAARRLPDGWLHPGHLDTAERFIDRYVLRGRCPADDLRARMHRAPTEAIRWAREPLRDTGAREPPPEPATGRRERHLPFSAASRGADRPPPHPSSIAEGDRDA